MCDSIKMYEKECSDCFSEHQRSQLGHLERDLWIRWRLNIKWKLQTSKLCSEDNNMSVLLDV